MGKWLSNREIMFLFNILCSIFTPLKRFSSWILPAEARIHIFVEKENWFDCYGDWLWSCSEELICRCWDLSALSSCLLKNSISLISLPLYLIFSILFWARSLACFILNATSRPLLLILLNTDKTPPFARPLFPEYAITTSALIKLSLSTKNKPKCEFYPSNRQWSSYSGVFGQRI